MATQIVEIEHVMQNLRGAKIDSGELTDDSSLLLKLEDGRTVVFTGEFVVAICSRSKWQLQ